MATDTKKGRQVAKRQAITGREADLVAKRKSEAGLSDAEKVELRQHTLHRLAGKRVSKAVAALSGVANLASYEPTDAQTAAILKAVGDAYRGAEQRLRNPKQKGSTAAFELPK